MLLQQIINGITLGMVYALIAVGYSLVFGILRLMNMAHGSIYCFGAHMALMLVGFKFGAIPAAIGAMVLTGILTALVIVLQLLCNFVKVSPFAITLVLIPIVIGAATCGLGRAPGWDLFSASLPALIPEPPPFMLSTFSALLQR